MLLHELEEALSRTLLSAIADCRGSLDKKVNFILSYEISN